MTKISQLSSIGDSLAVNDQFLIRDVDDATTPNKSVTVSGITRALDVGSATAPAIAFASDKNTGIYSPGADQVAISTNGAGRVFVNSSGNVGVGTSSPNVTGFSGSTVLTVSNTTASTNTGVIEIQGGASGNGILTFLNGAQRQSMISNVGGGSDLQFWTGGASISEKARLTASGQWLVGTSSSVSNVYLGGNAHQQLVQVVTATNSYANGLTALNYSASGFAPVISLGLSKSNSLGSNTAVASGDELGIINFVGNDGTNFRSGAFILAAADGGVSTGDLPTRLVFSTTADGASSPTERMRISSSGLLTAYSSNANGVNLTSSFGSGTDENIISGYYGATSTTSNGTASFVVRTNGNVLNTNNSYAGISDIKLKENIVDATSQWSDIKSLQIRKYNFKEGQTHTQIGLIAQEVELVSPGLVSESPDRDEDGNDLGTVTKSVNYSVLYMKAVKALQEAMERIETLEAKVAALEGA